MKHVVDAPFMFVLIKTMHLIDAINSVLHVGIFALCAIICYFLLPNGQLCIVCAPPP